MSRKRSRNDDDYRDKKRAKLGSPPAADIEDRLESLIYRVGEKSSSSLENNLEGLSEVLLSDLGKYKSNILSLLVEVPVKMPNQTTIYSTLIGLLNVKNYSFGGEYVDLLLASLKDALKNCKFDNAQLILRFMADLVNCKVIVHLTFLNLLNTFVDVIHEANVPQVRTDWYVYAVLSCLPWVGRELFEKKEPALEHTLASIENYIAKRQKNYHSALRVWESDSPHLQEEYIDSLWAQISKLRADKWIEHHIMRPYLTFDNLLHDALQHQIPTVSVPLHRDDNKYPYPSVVFRLFDYTDCPEGMLLPGAHSIDRYLIEEHIRSIMKSNHLDKKVCSEMLLNLPGKHKIPLEYMIVEVILGEMLRLPVSKYLIINMSSILLELCKRQPSSMPQVLAQAVELIYERLDTMNPECINRFSAWFAHHLSNFLFRWGWETWSDCLVLDKLHPKTKFVTDTISKCIRLSYHQRIVDILPQNFSVILPPVPNPICKYFQDGSEMLPGNTVAQQVLKAIKERCSPEELLSKLKDLPNPLQDEEDSSFNPLKIEIFVQTLQYATSKSITHFIAATAKYLFVYKSLVTHDKAQGCVLKNTYEIWRNNHQVLLILIEKYLKGELVDYSTVVNWVFSKEMAHEFTSSFMWEILHKTIGQLVNRVNKLQKELDAARAKQQRVEDDDGYMDREDSITEVKIERMEERLEAAHRDQKKLFLIIFQHFLMLQTDRKDQCEKDGTSINDLWFKWTLGQLQSIFFNYHEIVFQYHSTLETIMFTNETDPHILAMFQRFTSLQN